MIDVLLGTALLALGVWLLLTPRRGARGRTALSVERVGDDATFHRFARRRSARSIQPDPSLLVFVEVDDDGRIVGALCMEQGQFVVSRDLVTTLHESADGSPAGISYEVGYSVKRA